MSAGPGQAPSRVIRGQGMLAVSALGQLVISLVTIGLVGRWLSPAAFALFGLVGAIFSISRDLLDLGSTGVATKLLARHPERSASVVGVVIAWRALLALAGMSAVVAYAARSVPEADRTMVVIAGVVLGASVTGAFNAVFNARHRQTLPAIASILVQGGGLVALVLLRECGIGERSAVWMIIVREACWWIVVALIGVRVLGGLPERTRSWADCRAVVGPGITFGLAVLVHQLLVQGDVILARWLSGEVTAAMIAASARPLGAMAALPWIAAAPLIAVAAALAHRGGSADRLTRSAVPLGICAGAGVALLGAASAPGILTALYGPRYAAEPQAVEACRAFCVVLGAATAAAPSAMILVGLHREREILICAAIPVALATALKCLGVFGREAAELARVTAAAEAFLALLLAWACLRLSNSETPDRLGSGLTGLWFPLSVLAGGVAAVWMLGQRPLTQLLLALVVGLVFLALIARTGLAREYRAACAGVDAEAAA